MNRTSRLFVSVILAFLCVTAPARLTAAADDSARLIVFGDSLSDSGGNPAPSPPYFAGRWSNGYTWADALAARYGLGQSLVPSSTAGGTNYARAAARITGTNGVVDQIVSYLEDAHWRADKRATYFVFIGGNDIRDGLISAFTDPTFNPAAFIDRRIATLSLALSGLAARGARHIVVLNLPDLAHLPGLPPPAAPLASFMSLRFNAGLRHVVRLLDQVQGDASLVNVAQFFDGILADAAAGGGRSGITNVTQTCLTMVNNVPVTCSNPSAYLFWDAIHPTAQVHEMLADYVADTLARDGHSKDGH